MFTKNLRFLDKYCIKNGLPNFKNGQKNELRPLGANEGY
jgi:hypothetical protein